MFEKILVPLDGSKLAETALFHVRNLAGQTEAEVYLLHICPAEHQAFIHMHQIYLNSIADDLRNRIKEGFPHVQEPKVFNEVIPGDPLKVIFEYAKQKSISLVATTACGASGLRAMTVGSIADKIVRAVGVPTLLIRVTEDNNLRNQGLIRKILLPLDMSEASKISVPYTLYLAKIMKASITLFCMAQTVYSQNLNGIGPGVGANWDAVDRAAEQYANDYLKKIEEEIRAAGIEVNRTTYLGIDAAYEILEMEKKVQADLVVMATRGRSPIARWAFGSVAEKVLREGDRPLLLIKE